MKPHFRTALRGSLAVAFPHNQYLLPPHTAHGRSSWCGSCRRTIWAV
ncbi:hypothetical protein OLV30_05465 [Campylobacter jejuni]|nr:hypothetical protein [Campylobacter jejuni]